jgi:hypothetical protein
MLDPSFSPFSWISLVVLDEDVVAEGPLSSDDFIRIASAISLGSAITLIKTGGREFN